MGHQHIVHVTLSPCCRERRQSLALQRCGHLIRQIWIRWTTASAACFKRGSTARRSMMWRSWKNVCWGSGGCWTMHTVITAAIAHLHSRLNACVRVNGGHFEHKFWASDFLLCFICFIDTLWSYVILIVEVRFFETHCSYLEVRPVRCERIDVDVTWASCDYVQCALYRDSHSSLTWRLRLYVYSAQV